MEYNMNDKRRLEIMSPYLDTTFLNLPFCKDKNIYCLGGIIHFHNLPAAIISQLFEENFLYKKERQNYSPSAEEFYNFMLAHPNMTAHGYMVSPDREDYRITIEGLECNNECAKDYMIDFAKFIAEYEPDEYTINENNLRCWWD